MRRAYVLIKADKNDQESVRDLLSPMSEIVMVDLVWGAYDMVAVVEAEDGDSLSQFIMREILHNKFVNETLTFITL